jgi:hypothetical protein
MTVDWLAFLEVFAVAIIASALVVTLYSVGIRLLATPGPVAEGEGSGPARDDENDDVEEAGRPRSATLGAYACFGVTGLVVLYGIYLIIPALHAS